MANSASAHTAQTTVKIQSDYSAAVSFQSLVQQGYQADSVQYPTIYHAIACALGHSHSVTHDQRPTSDEIETVYWSTALRLSASGLHSFVNDPEWSSDHIAQRLRADLSNNVVLIPFVISLWSQAMGLPVSTIHKIGILARCGTHDDGRSVDAAVYELPSQERYEHVLWLLPNEVASTALKSRPWSLLIPPKSSTLATGLTTDLATAWLDGTYPDEDQFLGPSSSRQAVGLFLDEQTEALLASQALSKEDASLKDSPNLSVRRSAAGISHIGTRQDQSDVHYWDEASDAKEMTWSDINVPTMVELRTIRNAPSSYHDLPWDLLADCTLEELLVYYPSHVFNWPGLAIMYNHYIHRMVGNKFDYANAARRIAASHGTTDANALKSKVRQWIRTAGNELISTRDYDAEEKDHYLSLYEMVKQSKSSNVSDYLHKVMRRPPERLPNPLPPIALAEVGKMVLEGYHPSGRFSERVQSAMRAEQLGLPAPHLSATLPQTSASAYHPMIATLADRTRTMDERLQEEVAEYNEQFDESQSSWCIRPMSRFHTKQWRRRRDGNGDVNEREQIWEWMNDTQTVMEHLDEKYTREQIIKQHWRDLEGDTFLWLQMEYRITEIIDMLPIAALAEFNALSLDSAKEGSRSNRKGQTTAKQRLNGAMRKRKELAFVDRVKHNQDGRSWNHRARERNLLAHPANKALYDAEKSRYDAWVRKAGFSRKKRKRCLNDNGTEIIPRKRVNRNEQKTAANMPLIPLAVIPTQPTTQLQDDVHTLPMDASLHAYHANSMLFTYPNGMNSIPTVVVQGDTARGSVPQWWRNERYNLLKARGIEFDQRILEKLFRQGYDVLPSRYDTFAWEFWPGEFPNGLSPLNGAASIIGPGLLADQNLADFKPYVSTDNIPATDTSPRFDPFFDVASHELEACVSGLPICKIEESIIDFDFRCQLDKPSAQPASFVVKAGMADTDIACFPPLPAFTLTSQDLDGAKLDRTSRSSSTSSDRSFFSKYINSDE